MQYWYPFRTARKRPAMALLAAAGLAILTQIGCGGNLGLTGGSVPVGSARLDGTVVRADNLSQRVTGAALTLTSGPYRSTATSGLNGAFDFGSIAPGHFRCAIERPLGSGLGLNWYWEFDLPADTPAHMIAAMWPDAFSVATVNRVALAPGTVTLHVGQSVRFVAAASDKTGQTLPVSPSLMLQGDIGDLGADGTFRATAAGHGTMLAWMPEHTVRADITVIP